MNDLTTDERISLLMNVRWGKIDMPARYRRCWRIRPYRWLATAGVLRKREPSRLCCRTVGDYVGWTITLAWLQVWWYRPLGGRE